VSYCGIILLERYQRSGRLADLDEAIASLESAVRLAMAILGRNEWSPDVATAFSQLGSALRNRYLRTRNLADIDRAVSLGRRAVELSEADAAEPAPPHSPCRAPGTRSRFTTTANR